MPIEETHFSFRELLVIHLAILTNPGFSSPASWQMPRPYGTPLSLEHFYELDSEKLKTRV